MLAFGEITAFGAFSTVANKNFNLRLEFAHHFYPLRSFHFQSVRTAVISEKVLE